MPHRLEITLKDDLFDARGDSVRRKAEDYFGLVLDSVKVIDIITVDADLTLEQCRIIKEKIFTNPVTQISSFTPLAADFDWLVWIGYRPGVRDNPGSTAVEAIEDLLGFKFSKDEAVYTSKIYSIKGRELSRNDLDLIAGELLANDIIEQWRIFSRDEWDPDKGTGFIIPRVRLNHNPSFAFIPVESDSRLAEISRERGLALNPNDIPVIREYFLNDKTKKERALMGLSGPTDIELEYISQARSDHCNHNTFRGLFHYTDLFTGKDEVIDNLFKTCIEAPTLSLKEEKNWVVSVLWDNAGVGRFDRNHHYVITGETHNSPSNMEAYGGAITGIVGVYRDPLGTGKGAKLVMGSYGFCTGMQDYAGDLVPRLHPRRLLDGVVEGVRDGGNKSGIPTTFGQVCFHPGYMGKALVFVTCAGIMPAFIKGLPTETKTTSPGDLIVMCGGRVGKDGIHGVTASSEVFSENTPAGHVQIGDPYTQKKMHDFILEARDKGLIAFITDNGGGGLSSSIGESARFSNGCKVDLEKVPLKYEGLDQWEIWISESQERMTVAVKPEHLEQFMAVSAKHAVESTVIGVYTDTGKLHITCKDETCAFIDIDFLASGFPQWKFEAVWIPPDKRGLYEPVFKEPEDYNSLLLDMLARPNICSKEWITRQYDHEVQGSSVVKPLTGVERDVNNDAVVIRPVLESKRGLLFSQALLPFYSLIDAYHMTACTIDEAVRRLIAVGADPGHIGGVDNFCWPDIQFRHSENPDGKFKAAQLVRSCRALRDICLSYGIPLLSGKDSMYVDGYPCGKYGETHKVSALETLQFSAISVMNDATLAVTMDSKMQGDLVYLIGLTRNELGASEYYDAFGYTGLNIPKVHPDKFYNAYSALSSAIQKGLIASAHGVYRGGLGVHLAMTAFAGNFGMELDLSLVPVEKNLRNDFILFSESAGRFIITVAPGWKNKIEAIFKNQYCACIGKVTGENGNFTIKGTGGGTIISVPVKKLKEAWKRPFRNRI